MEQEHVKALSKNVQAQQHFTNAALTAKASSKGSSGLFAKYKNMKEKRRSQGSDTGDDRQDGSSSPGLLEYSPLGKVDTPEGRVDIEASSSPYAQQVSH